LAVIYQRRANIQYFNSRHFYGGISKRGWRSEDAYNDSLVRIEMGAIPRKSLRANLQEMGLTGLMEGA